MEHHTHDTDTPEANTGQEKDPTYHFLRGLLFGVLLVLICMGSCLLFFQLKRLRQLTDSDEADSSELKLDQSRVNAKISALEELINKYYLGDIDQEQVEDMIYQGMIAGLGDIYSVYYPADDLESMEESSAGEYSGIGVTLSQDRETGEITVVDCLANTPASEAGLQAGDVITKYNGTSVDGMSVSDLVSQIKTEESDALTLTILRDGEELEKDLTKTRITVETVEACMLEDGIGYLQITEFDAVTTAQFTEGLESLEEQGMEKLVIDLRDNPGGGLSVVCDILDQLLPEGLIVYTEDKNGEKEEYYSDEEHQFTKPLAVLINGDSASAAEIFAGAVKDYGLGTLVGTTTYGKGVVQRVISLSDGTGVKLTVSKYYTPNGTDINQKGIEPDIAVEAEDKSTEDAQKAADTDGDEDLSSDAQLQKALEVLREK